VKIARVESTRERIALSRPYEIASTSTSHVELFVVRVVPERGPIGLGCAAPADYVTGETAAACAEALADDRLTDLLAGRDLRQRGGLCRAVEAAMFDTPAARAAVDTAVWDAFALMLDLPLVDYLGRCHDFLPTSITIGIKGIDETAAEAREYLDRGFCVLKVKLGHSIEEDLARLHKLREEVGPNIRVRVDANEGYTLPETRRLFDAAAKLDLELIEQPVPRDSVEELLDLTPAQREQIALDESLITDDDALEQMMQPLAGLWVLKLMKCGGVTAALRQATLARAASRHLMWGCMDESVISIAAALHAAYACPATRYLDLDGSFDLSRDPAAGGFSLQGGQLVLTDAPGLGVTPGG